MQTLIQMARDIYPHDRLADRFYAVAVKGYDEKAATDPATKATGRGGRRRSSTRLARRQHGVAYVDVGWEAERVALLRQIEDGAFFQKVRGELVVSLYNQKEVWPLFGYEGEGGLEGRLHQPRLQRHHVALRARQRRINSWREIRSQRRLASSSSSAPAPAAARSAPSSR